MAIDRRSRNPDLAGQLAQRKIRKIAGFQRPQASFNQG